VPGILFLSRAEVADLLDPDALRPALADAFRRFSAGAVSAPPRSAAVAPNGLVAAMSAHLPGAGLSVKLVAVHPGNHARGLPSHQALITVFDEETGTPLAVLDGTHITAVRTGASAAVAADVLARRDARVLAVLGAGVQGRSHLDAFPRVRDFAEIRIASRTPGHAVELAGEHPAARAVGSFEEAVRGADVVCCCTDSPEPVVEASWLSPGVHLSSVGFGRELDAGSVAAGRVFVEWRGAGGNPPPAGAAELQDLDPAAITEIGEVLNGTRPGRTGDEEITVYKSTGHAVEDAAAARLVLDRALATGRGTTVEL
jgi:alanine dehydrogenase